MTSFSQELQQLTVATINYKKKKEPLPSHNILYNLILCLERARP